jgi:hypothetical protein
MSVKWPTAHHIKSSGTSITHGSGIMYRFTVLLFADAYYLVYILKELGVTEILDHQTRPSIFVLVVIRMWNLCLKQRKEKVMIKTLVKSWMKI